MKNRNKRLIHIAAIIFFFSLCILFYYIELKFLSKLSGTIFGVLLLRTCYLDLTKW